MKQYTIEFKVKNPEYQEGQKWAVWASLTSEPERKKVIKALKEDWKNTYEFREGE